jgi:hypothetical protein
MTRIIGVSSDFDSFKFCVVAKVAERTKLTELRVPAYRSGLG